MITRPDEYKHQNDNYAIVDNDNVRGGIFDLVTISNANLLTLPLDKRQLRTTITNGSDNKHYVYTGSTLDDTAWGTVGNWTVASGSGYTHPTGFTNQPSVALTSGNVISQITVNSNGHTTGVVSRLLTPGDIGAATTSHTHSNATTSVAGFMSGADKTKLDGITAGAEANQNAFSYVTVGATTLSATGDTDTLTLSAGTGITLTPDALTKSVVVSSTGSGTSAYGFGTIAVSGQSNVVADSVNDTLTFAGSGSTKVTTVPTSDIVIINSETYSGSTNSEIDSEIILTPGTYSGNILSDAITAQGISPNLNGKTIRFIFQEGVFNITSSIFISVYNGTVILSSSAANTTATINCTGEFGCLNPAGGKQNLTISNLIFNLNFTNANASYNYFIRYSTSLSYSSFFNIRGCTINIISAVSNSNFFAFQIPVSLDRIQIYGCSFSGIGAFTGKSFLSPSTYSTSLYATGVFTTMRIHSNTSDALMSFTNIFPANVYLKSNTTAFNAPVSDYTTFVFNL